MKKGKKIKTTITTDITELPKTQSLSQVVINVKPSIQDNITDLPGYEKEDYDIKEIKHKSVCWNCCHDIKGKHISQPIKYEQNVFTTTGSFCCYPCVARYIVDSNDSSDIIFSRLSTLNLYVNILNNTQGKVIPAPPRLSLTMFGGTMSIEDYRNNMDDYLTVMNIDPIVCCIDISIKKLAYKKQTVSDNKKEFKLYRRNKKTSSNDIYTSMNLVSD